MTGRKLDKQDNSSQKKKPSSEESAVFRNNLIAKRKDFKNLKEWTDYCSKIVKLLEKSATLTNNQLKGELSEVVLEQYLIEVQKLLKSFGIPSLIMKNLGMIHRSESNQKLYSSEIDVCLVTPFRAYLFEAKSYTGDKTLTKECYLTAKSKIDIYAQSKMHLDFFNYCFGDCRIKYTGSRTKLKLKPPFKLLFFQFSTGKVIDNREDKWKKEIPYISVNNLFDWFGDEIDFKAKPQWDLSLVEKRFKTLDKNRDMIMQYHVDRLNDKSKQI